jgi:hypothetical protein
MHEMLDKDDKIIRLARELREYERKMQDIHSVFNSNRINNTKNS